MLEACRHCGGRLALGAVACFRCGRLVVADEGGTGTGSSAVHAPTNLGTVARSQLLENQWRLVRVIGQGAVGQVWLAHDVTLDRDVAVKLMHTALADDPAQIARFEREARVLAGCEHPNLLDVLGIGRFEGRPFLVTRLLEGRTLAELLHQRGGKLVPAEAARVLVPIAEALGSLHESKIVHRDLKPSNIWVSDDGHATLMDLGSAFEGNSDLTRQGELLGTPGYLSPEQIAGKRDLDGRSDVYALGCLLYEVLCGQVPFDGELPQVIAAHASAERPVAAGVPPALSKLARRAMSISPADRPTALDFKAELAPFLPAPASREAPTIGAIFSPTSGTAAFPQVELPKPAPVPSPPKAPVPASEQVTAPRGVPLTVRPSDTVVGLQPVAARPPVESTKQLVALVRKGRRPPAKWIAATAGAALVLAVLVAIPLSERPAPIPEPARVDNPAVFAPVQKDEAKIYAVQHNLEPAPADRVVYVPELQGRKEAVNAPTGAANQPKRSRTPDRSRLPANALRITTTWNGDVRPVLCWFDGKLAGQTPVLIGFVRPGIHRIEVDAGDDERRLIEYPMPKNARMKEGVRLELELNDELKPADDLMKLNLKLAQNRGRK